MSNAIEDGSLKPILELVAAGDAEISDVMDNWPEKVADQRKLIAVLAVQAAAGVRHNKRTLSRLAALVAVALAMGTLALATQFSFELPGAFLSAVVAAIVSYIIPKM